VLLCRTKEIEAIEEKLISVKVVERRDLPRQFAEVGGMSMMDSISKAKSIVLALRVVRKPTIVVDMGLR